MSASSFATAGVRTRLSFVLVLCGLLPATGVRAGIVPLVNGSISRSSSTANGKTDTDERHAGAGEFEFYGLALSQIVAEGNHTDWADGGFDLYVDMGTECLLAQVRCDASSFGSTAHSVGNGLIRMLFTVNETQEYNGVLTFIAHALPGPNHWMRLTDIAHHEYWSQDGFGTTQPAGRIAPGSYWVEGAVDYTETSDTGDGTEMTLGLCFQPCTPVVTQQPQDVVASPGSTVDVQLTASSAAPAEAAALQRFSRTASSVTNTYQWRRNLVSLANGGHFSGVTTNHLVITNAAYADSGSYDCLVTQGSIVEPSRQAHVAIHQTTDVETFAGEMNLQFGTPRPNPFFASTTLEFVLPSRVAVGLDIYDALGRRIRTLLPVESRAPGSYSIEWDGKDANGTPAASGVYFARLAAGDTRVIRRAILMTGAR